MAIKRKDSEDKGDQPVLPPVDANTPPPGGSSITLPTPSGMPFTPVQYQPANYGLFQKGTGYGYDDWYAQMRDAFTMPSRGAGIFGELGGNNLPRYAFGNRPGGMPPSSGFNAGAFLAPYLAAIQPPGGGSPGAPPGVPPVPGGPPAMPPGVGGARGLLGPSQPMMPAPGAAMPPSANGIRGGLLGSGGPAQAQSPMAAFLAQLLAQQNMSGPGGMRGGR